MFYNIIVNLNLKIFNQKGPEYNLVYAKVKDPDASIRDIKLAAMQASGYQTLAAGLRSTSVGAKRVPLAHSTAEWACQHVRMSACSLPAGINKGRYLHQNEKE